MNKSNFSLLTQDEIDTLVNFLSDHKNNFSGEVLSQESIDKLIFLMKNKETNRIRFDVEPVNRVSESVLEKSGLFSNGVSIGVLQYEINSDTHFLELYAVNVVTKEKHSLTPANFFERNFEDSKSSWGYSIAPVIFDEIATAFRLKYSDKDYNAICKLFALKNFGNETYELNATFLANESSVLKNLI